MEINLDDPISYHMLQLLIMPLHKQLRKLVCSVTHTFQNYGTKISYNELLLPAFSLYGEWLGMTLDYRELRSSQTLKPSTEWTWSYRNSEYLMNEVNTFRYNKYSTETHNFPIGGKCSPEKLG